MKPILKVELPRSADMDQAKKIQDSLKNMKDLTEEYHIMVLIGNTDFIDIKIVTADDVTLHR